MEQAERKLHSLEKIVATTALVAVLALSVGFAKAAGPKKKAQDQTLAELHSGHADMVKLRSSVALVQDAATGETILDKNSDVVLPIASITKLMTAMVVLDAGLELDEEIKLGREDVDRLKGTKSRLRTGLVLTRDDLLLLALMASENRAAAALGRAYPGGIEAFVGAMNEKARSIGMMDSHFVDSTGLSSGNVASAQDLARLVTASYQYPLIREYSTRERGEVKVRKRRLSYVNTNNLVRSSKWDVELSKTGYISEAGRCLVMRVRMASKDLVVVLLDSWGKYSRIGDARRIRKWLETSALVEPRS